MVGVYMGRDLANLAKACAQKSNQYHLVGVDKFNNEPCGDWPLAKRGLGWKEAGFGDHPQIELAQKNIEKNLPRNVSLSLIQSNDLDYLGNKNSFDVVYLDASHDYQSVKNQIALLHNVCHKNTLICGDDYSDEGEWGVKRAVGESFTKHNVFMEWIWIASFSNLK